ncbi:hypothetical protein C1645_811490 [Glomus cerebriforme]|uniref:Uncharacterized protein n=1 Tax=Glomus cerebriforme TaxID=658196 RepID=A0A397TRB3_9GLOM|nr:hypothetical protein C1645_811490 [Glomus cerebriforme]
MSQSQENIKAGLFWLDIGDIYRDSLKAYEEYEACLTTSIYDDTYLDQKNVKLEVLIQSTEEKGFRAMFQEFIAKIPPEYVNKDLKFSDCFDDFLKKENKGNKSYKKLSTKKIRSLLVKASYLIDHKIKLEDRLYVKVVAIKMNKDGVFWR